MQAVVLTAFQGPDALIVSEVPDPILCPGAVLLRIEAAAIGPWDVYSTYGMFAGMGGSSSFPQIMGWDFCGEIAAIADDVSGWQVGERVLGFTPQPWMGAGVFASHASLPAALLARAPDGLAPSLAATLPVAILTADVALNLAGLTSGAKALVIGAVGAVGSYVTQLAAMSGAVVVASVSTRDAEDALALGASFVLDREGDVAEQTKAALGQVDAIIDLVGPAARASALPALKPGGRFVTTIPGDLPQLPPLATAHVVGVQPNPARLSELAGLVASGRLKAEAGSKLPLTQARRGYELSARAGRRKVVLVP